MVVSSLCCREWCISVRVEKIHFKFSSSSQILMECYFIPLKSRKPESEDVIINHFDLF